MASSPGDGRMAGWRAGELHAARPDAAYRHRIAGRWARRLILAEPVTRLRLIALTVDEWTRRGLASIYVIFFGVMLTVAVGFLLAEIY